jgi:hypothetical protein
MINELMENGMENLCLGIQGVMITVVVVCSCALFY